MKASSARNLKNTTKVISIYKKDHVGLKNYLERDTANKLAAKQLGSKTKITRAVRQQNHSR